MNVRKSDRVRADRAWSYQDGFAIKGQGTVTSDPTNDYAYVLWDDDPKRVERPFYCNFLVVETGLDVMLELL